jgi:hypothetical protein
MDFIVPERRFRYMFAVMSFLVSLRIDTPKREGDMEVSIPSFSTLFSQCAMQRTPPDFVSFVSCIFASQLAGNQEVMNLSTQALEHVDAN